jgi:hypothetical protein
MVLSTPSIAAAVMVTPVIVNWLPLAWATDVIAASHFTCMFVVVLAFALTRFGPAAKALVTAKNKTIMGRSTLLIPSGNYGKF